MSFNIEVKGGTSVRLPTAGKYCDRDIVVTASGGGAVAVAEKDVNFYDYDGTCLYAYTIAEAQALTELPPLPEHDGLICQGWNWDLADVKALTRKMNIGAMYITDDGKTRLHIRVWDLSRGSVTLCFSQTVANGVAIDWGDGSVTETISGTGNVTATHTYIATGSFVIALAVAEGCTLGLGHGVSTTTLMGSNANAGFVFCNLLQEVYIGSNVTGIGRNAFHACRSLSKVAIPKGVGSIGVSAFYGCYSLISATVPSGVTNLSMYAFFGCYSIKTVTLPKTVSGVATEAFRQCHSMDAITIPDNAIALSDYMFQTNYGLADISLPSGTTKIGNNFAHSCYALTNFTIPEKVTSIGSSAFYYCYGLGKLRFLPTTPPTVSNANAFTGIPTDCVVEVPAASLAAYQAATNYSGIAAQMVGV